MTSIITVKSEYNTQQKKDIYLCNEFNIKVIDVIGERKKYYNYLLFGCW